MQVYFLVQNYLSLNDYYSILSLSRGASSEEIRRAYKRLALQFHPDKNLGDIHAEERFKQVNEAYQILSDPNKKAQYDYLLTYGYAQNSTGPANGPTPKKSYYQGQKVRPEPRKLNFLYVYIFLGFALFVFIGFYFFSFMEKKAAKSIYADAEKLYNLEKNPRAALEYLELALEKDASLAPAYFLAGKILFVEAADYQNSLYYFDNAVIEGNGVSDSIGVYYYWRGKNKLKLEDYVSGVNDLEAAFAYFPENIDLMLLLADAYLYKLSDFDKAIFYYDEVLIKQPQNYDALLGKAVTLQKETEYKEAEKYLENAWVLRPEAAELYYYQAIQALNFRKDTVAACQLWQKASEKGVKEASLQIEKYCD